MSNKKNFSERILDVFAAVMKKAAPQFCCQYLTRKSSKRAQKFIPSLDDEERAYKEMSADEARNRVWSKEFRVELLKKKDYTLIDDISSQEEILTILLNWNSSIDICAIACKHYTPSHETLLHFMKDTEKNRSRVVELASALPEIFINLPKEEICGDGSDLRLMWLVLGKKPKRSEEFLNVLLKSGSYTQTDVNILVETALRSKLDISQHLKQLRIEFPKIYSEIRLKSETMGSAGAEYFRTGYYLTKMYLDKEDNRDLRSTPINGNLRDVADAFAWLRVGYSLLPNNQRVADLFFEEWNFLKGRLNEKVFNQLCERLAKEAPTAWSAASSVRVLPEEFKAMAVQHLLSFKNENSLKHFFPFTDWTEEQQKTAVKLLARKKEFPLEKLDMLSDDLQKIALEELEIASELDLVLSGNVTKATKIKLHPEAEIALLTLSYRFVDKKLEYVSNFRLSDEAFKALANAKGEYHKDTERYEEIISVYAKERGLTTTQYCILMNSPRAHLAPELKSYIPTK